MTAIFLLTPAKVPDADLLIQTLNAHAYAIQSVLSLQELENHLKDNPQAVVLFPVDEQQPHLHPTAISGFSAKVATIGILSEEATTSVLHNTRPLYVHTDFLRHPYNELEVLSRTASALRQVDLQTRLDTCAQFDELTQLYNQPYFMNRLNEEISLSKRHLSPLACGIIAINFYPMYMDSYGFDGINAMLKHVADVIRLYKRQEDIVARIGDDEIGLLLPHSTEKGAKVLASRIMDAIHKSPIDFGQATENISTSCGIAGFPLQDETQQEITGDSLIRFAHHALHNARCTPTEPLQLFSDITPLV